MQFSKTTSFIQLFVTLGYAFVGYSHRFRRRTCHTVGKLVHDEMAVDRQAATILMVGKIKELLKKLRIEDTDKEVKTRIVVWYQCKQSNFLFAQRGQVKFIRSCQTGKALQIEFFKPCGKGDLNAL